MELLGLTTRTKNRLPGFSRRTPACRRMNPTPASRWRILRSEDRPLEVLIDDLGSDDAEVRERGC